jgi:hypothetical protein
MRARLDAFEVLNCVLLHASRVRVTGARVRARVSDIVVRERASERARDVHCFACPSVVPGACGLRDVVLVTADEMVVCDE